MKRNAMYRLFAVLCWLLFLAMPVRAWAAPAPVDVNLRAGDLPHGFHMYSSITVTGTQLVQSGGSHAFRMRLRNLSLAQLEAFADTAAQGLIFLESDTLLYRSATAARADFVFAARAPVLAPLQRLAIAGVGAEYFARTHVVTRGGERERYDDLVFRRGPYIYLLRAVGINDTFSPAQVVALARIVDARIQHAR
jgi:hypothetical protein